MASARRIDQVIPTLASRDAIGRHTLQLRDLLREMGFGSDIYYLNASSDVLDEGRHIDKLDDTDHEGRWLLYQLSIGSPAAVAFAQRPEPKLVDYHNITPVELFELWEPQVAEELRLGRKQMRQLAPLTTFAMADSSYNEIELKQAGYRATAVGPLLIDIEDLRGKPDEALSRELESDRSDGGHELLFVGKVSPHKAQHDLIKTLAAYRRLYDPSARLRAVGGAIGDAYPWALERLAESLGVAEAVHLPGSVTHSQLISYYRAADVFVCLSEHEGFCVPLVEAMVHGLPVVAYGTAAVPDTVGDAGIVLDTKEPVRVAAAIDRVVRDGALRSLLAQGADERVASMSLERSRASFAEVIRTAIAGAERSSRDAV